jgi:hypothetical protein
LPNQGTFQQFTRGDMKQFQYWILALTLGGLLGKAIDKYRTESKLPWEEGLSIVAALGAAQLEPLAIKKTNVSPPLEEEAKA